MPSPSDIINILKYGAALKGAVRGALNPKELGVVKDMISTPLEGRVNPDVLKNALGEVKELQGWRSKLPPDLAKDPRNYGLMHFNPVDYSTELFKGTQPPAMPNRPALRFNLQTGEIEHNMPELGDLNSGGIK